MDDEEEEMDEQELDKDHIYEEGLHDESESSDDAYLYIKSKKLKPNTPADSYPPVFIKYSIPYPNNQKDFCMYSLFTGTVLGFLVFTGSSVFLSILCESLKKMH